MPLVQLRNVSASQKTAWDACQRKWHFQSVMKRPRAVTPAQLRGTGIHAECEHYMRTGVIRESEWSAYVRAAIPFLPLYDSAGRDYLVERKFSLPTVPGGPPWIGFVDLEIHWPRPIILDYKTTSDFRYNKTPAELERDTQLCCYAHQFYLEHPECRDVIEVGHLYLLTKNKTPKGVYVSANVTRERAAEQWAISMQAISEMIAVDVEDTLELPPNTASCGMYGGCDFRADCGLVPSKKTIRKEGEEKMAEESFMTRLLRSVGAPPMNGAAAPPAAAPPAAGAFQAKIAELRAMGMPADMAFKKAQDLLGLPQELGGKPAPAAPAVPVGIVPPDGAPRDTVDIREATPPKKGKGRPKKAKDVPATLRCNCGVIVTRFGDSDSYQHPSGGACPRAGMALSKDVALAYEAEWQQKPAGAPVVPPVPYEFSEATAAAHFGDAALKALHNSSPVAATKAPYEPPTVTSMPLPAALADFMTNVDGDPTPGLAAKIGQGTSVPGASLVAAPAPSKARRSLTLYIDCVPEKGDDATELADWIAGSLEKVARENDVTDWQLVKYATVADGLLASALRERLAAGDIPEALVVRTGARAATVALEALIPWATKRVRGVR